MKHGVVLTEALACMRVEHASIASRPGCNTRLCLGYAATTHSLLCSGSEGLAEPDLGCSVLVVALQNLTPVCHSIQA